MRSGSGRNLLVPQVALVMLAAGMLPGCWIPLPEETAVVVEVLDSRGGPVDGVELLLDGTDTIITGSQLNEGQVFKSLSTEGDHTIQVDTSTLIDPQGGVGWVPLASRISGELLPLSFGSRPFAGNSTAVLTVPVSKGEITVVTIYLADALVSPSDNQWLTDGSNASAYRPDNNVDEFRDSPEPVFWWRSDPSLGLTVNFTFQLWVDGDNDTRYPLGIVERAQYEAVMDDTDPSYVQPDWQVPLAGIQRVKAGGVNQVILWSSLASDPSDPPSNPVDYDLYYSPESQWNNNEWENNRVIRDISAEGSLDGSASRFIVGAGSANPGVLLKNGVRYTFALRARDGSSNLDTLTSTSIRTGTPPGNSSTLGAVTVLSGVADSTVGGSIDLQYQCQEGDDLRVYAAPFSDFSSRPYDGRFIRDLTVCGPADPNTFRLADLVNGVTYSLGIEPFDASGNTGTASSIITATPSLSPSASDTTPPTTPLLTVTPTGNGNVDLTVSAVADSSSVIRRIYWAPAAFTANEEAMAYTDRPASPQTTVSLSDIPNNVPHNYVVRAIDSFGNSAIASSQITLSEADATGPVWASDDPGFYATFSYSTAATVWPLGASWSYSGLGLGQDPALGQGEYVWRIIQENPERGVQRSTKLGAFYTYPGYYYASTQSGGLNMNFPSGNADHRGVFLFVENALGSADVMGAPFDSSDSTGYRQRTAAMFGASLAAGSGTTNQLVLLYNTDEDGQAVVSPETGGGFLGIIKVLAVDKLRPLPTPQPHLQGKEFQLSYFTTDDELVTFPVPIFGGNIYYTGNLDDPDFTDPRW